MTAHHVGLSPAREQNKIQSDRRDHRIGIQQTTSSAFQKSHLAFLCHSLSPVETAGSHLLSECRMLLSGKKSLMPVLPVIVVDTKYASDLTAATQRLVEMLSRTTPAVNGGNGRVRSRYSSSYLPHTAPNPPPPLSCGYMVDPCVCVCVWRPAISSGRPLRV